jgi:hypothetical protein
MSHSYRTTPIIGNCVSISEAWYKAYRARRERRKVRQLIHLGIFPTYQVVPWNELRTSRDGKQRLWPDSPVWGLFPWYKLMGK